MRFPLFTDTTRSGEVKDVPVKVLQVLGAMNQGGAETMMMNVFRQIDREQFQFDFLSYSSEKAYYDDEIRALGGRIIYMDSPQKLGAFRFVTRLGKIIRAGHYDVVHAHTLYSIGLILAAAWRGRAKIRIAHAHANGDTPTGWKRRIYQRAMKLLVRLFSTRWMACSRGTGEYFFGKAFGEKGEVVPNGIRMESFEALGAGNPAAFREKNGLPADAWIIGQVGTMNEVKNYPFSVGLAQKLREKGEHFRMLFMGDGPEEESIRALCREKGVEDRVVFLGRRPDTAEWMQGFDVLICPSVYEGFGNVVLEAQAAGTAAVVSDRLTPDVDMGLGLVTYLPLEAEAEVWIEALRKASAQKREDNAACLQRIREKGYDAPSSAGRIARAYLGE